MCDDAALCWQGGSAHNHGVRGRTGNAIHVRLCLSYSAGMRRAEELGWHSAVRHGTVARASVFLRALGVVVRGGVVLWRGWCACLARPEVG